MRDVTLWKALLAFVLTFVGVYALAMWLGPLGFYGSGIYSVPPDTLAEAGLVFEVTLVANAIWWFVILLPSGIKRPAPA